MKIFNTIGNITLELGLETVKSKPISLYKKIGGTYFLALDTWDFFLSQQDVETKLTTHIIRAYHKNLST